MRLASIVSAGLPAGALHSLDLRLRPFPDAPVQVSFDQGRHVGAGDRPGSWLALSLRVPEHAPENLERAWRRVVARHGDLRTVFSRGDDGALACHEAEVDCRGWDEHPVGSSMDAAVRELLDATCRPFGAPSHRLCRITPDADGVDGRPVVVIASDHAHVDMWSMMVLAHDLLEALETGEDLPHAASFGEHSALLASAPPAPIDVREAWEQALAEGGDTMPVFPLPLGELSAPVPDVVEVRDVLDAAGAEGLAAAAAGQGVRTTALALALLAQVTEQLSGQRLRAVFPVHSRDEQRWLSSCGWFITNAVLDVPAADPAEAAAAVRRALTLGSVPLAPIFAPRGGMPVPAGMFALSWMDMRRMSVSLPVTADARAITASVPTNGLMIWFVLEDAGLHLRCRYPDTAVAHRSVSAWLDEIQRTFRRAAGA